MIKCYLNITLNRKSSQKIVVGNHVWSRGLWKLICDWKKHTVYEVSLLNNKTGDIKQFYWRKKGRFYFVSPLMYSPLASTQRFIRIFTKNKEHNNTLNMKKEQLALPWILILLYFAFLIRGEFAVFQCRDCLFVSGSHWKIHLSSQVAHSKHIV